MKTIKLTPLQKQKSENITIPKESKLCEEAVDRMVSMFIVSSYDEAVSIMQTMLTISILRIPTLNDLLKNLKLGTEKGGDEYGWPDLYPTVLQYGYGIIENPHYPSILFSFKFPKVSKLMLIKEKES